MSLEDVIDHEIAWSHGLPAALKRALGGSDWPAINENGILTILMENCSGTDADRAARLVRDQLNRDMQSTTSLICSIVVNCAEVDADDVLMFVQATMERAIMSRTHDVVTRHFWPDQG